VQLTADGLWFLIIHNDSPTVTMFYSKYYTLLMSKKHYYKDKVAEFVCTIAGDTL
jgi:hypothetical protein